MKRSSRARLCATATVGVLSLALITGCGGEDSADSVGSGNKASDTASGTAAKAATKAELEKLIVATGDVPGYTVKAADASATLPTGGLKLSNEQCRPLANVLSGQAPGDAAAQTNRSVTGAKPPASAPTNLEDLSEEQIEDSLTVSMDVAVTVVSLSSYEGDGAEKTMKSVSDAVTACAAGVTVTADGEQQKVTKIAAEKASGAGDEAVAFAVTGTTDETAGQSATLHGEVVRQGNLVSGYYTLNLGAMMTGKAYDVPDALVTAQTAKLK